MASKGTFRRMKVEDLERVEEIEVQNFSRPWSIEQFKYELNDNPYSRMFVIEVDGNIIAYYGIWITFEECQITTIAVEDHYKGHGYGSRMMEHLENEAREAFCERISLEVRVSNEKALHMYEKYGFEVINKRIGYYEAPREDAYVMMKGI